ncbi:MAG: phospholipase [Pirellulales bacterium]|nr:phospholipase [Pirellulales bacterium]
MPSETHVVTSTLRTLHRIHQQLQDLRDRLERGPRLVRAQETNIERLSHELAGLEAEAKSLRIATDKKQLQLDSGEAQVKRRQLQLQQAADNREYQALKEQIAADQMANSVLADEILEAMEKIDQMAARLTAARAAVEKAKQDAARLAKDFQEKEPLIRGDIDRLQQEMKQAETDLPGDFKLLYERLVRSRGEDALAAVTGDFCSGCNQQIPVNMINSLMLATPIQCKACGRLLYLPEDYSRR